MPPRLSISKNDECKRATIVQLYNLLVQCQEVIIVQRDDLKVLLEVVKETLHLVTNVYITARVIELEPSLSHLSKYKLVLNNKNIFLTPQKLSSKVSQEVLLKK